MHNMKQPFLKEWLCLSEQGHKEKITESGFEEKYKLL